MKVKSMKWVAWKCSEYENAEILGVYDTYEEARAKVEEEFEDAEDTFEWGEVTFEEVAYKVDTLN